MLNTTPSENKPASPELVTAAAAPSLLQVRSTVLCFDAFPVLRRLTLAGGLFKELRLPARLRQLTLGAGLMYNDISGAQLPREACAPY